MTRSLLLLEDDRRVRRVLRMALQDEGYRVTEACSGQECLTTLRTRPHDVVLVDILLPDIDGFTVCREIRRTSGVPVIMVTARTDSHDVVAGLEAGADDYVCKPVVAKELSARIRALLRRAGSEPPPAQPRRITFGSVCVGVDEGVVTVDGAPVSLTSTEFRLLVELASAPGVLLSRERLLERVWGYGYFGDGRLVDTHIRRLRCKVERDPAKPRHIVTARGLGYRLVA